MKMENGHLSTEKGHLQKALMTEKQVHLSERKRAPISKEEEDALM